MSGNGTFKPPGTLRLVVDWVGDQVLEFLMALGWVPKSEREKPGDSDGPQGM